MKNLESLKNFRLSDEELVNVNGALYDLPRKSGAGVLQYNGQNLGYSSDTIYDDGHIQYQNVNNIP